MAGARVRRGVEVPDTIESVVLSRIDRLQGEVKHVLQCASVIGRVFQRRLLEYVSGQQELLEEYLARLEEHELVYKERVVPEVEYSFKHALTQVTAYGGLLTRHRQTFHERIGVGIEALYEAQLDEYYEVLAYHYSRSANTAKAVDYSDQGRRQGGGALCQRAGPDLLWAGPGPGRRHRDAGSHPDSPRQPACRYLSRPGRRRGLRPSARGCPRARRRAR